MKAEIVVEVQQIREDRINAAVKGFVACMANLEKGCRNLVKQMSEMNDSERRSVVGRITGVKRDWLDRMEACAARGLLDAYHLYGPTRVAAALMIHVAAPEALKILAAPGEEFPVAMDNGPIKLVKASELNTRMLARAWDQFKGRIPVKIQLEKIKLEQSVKQLAGESSATIGTLESVNLYIDENGVKMVEQRVRGEDGQSFSVSVPFRQLAAVLK